MAHRMSWLLYRGEIPNDLFMLHRCDNPACVNPEHLFLGTQRDNLIDCKKKGRNGIGEQNGMAILSKKNVLAIFSDLRTYEKIAIDYGVTTSNVSMIKNGRSWSHITGVEPLNQKIWNTHPSLDEKRKRFLAK